LICYQFYGIIHQKRKVVVVYVTLLSLTDVLTVLLFTVSGEFLDCEGSGLYSLQSSCKLILSFILCYPHFGDNSNCTVYIFLVQMRLENLKFLFTLTYCYYYWLCV